MSIETTPQEPTDKRYHTASGEDITSVVAPAEEFIKQFCSSESENSSDTPALTQQTREAMLHTIRTVLYDNNMRGYNFPWDASDSDIHDDHNTAENMINERENYREATKGVPEEELRAIKKLQEVLGVILSDGLAPNAAKYHVLARIEYKIEIMETPDRLDWISQKILASEKETPQPVDAETVIEIAQNILRSKLAELQGDTNEKARLDEMALVGLIKANNLLNPDKLGLLDQLYEEILTRIDTIYSSEELRKRDKQEALARLADTIEDIRVDMMIAAEEKIAALGSLDEGDAPSLYNPDTKRRDPDRPILS